MKLKLVTLSGTKLDEDVYDVQIPTMTGTIGVYENHEPLITIATPGVLEIRRHKTDPDSDKEFYAINGGTVQVMNNEVKILVDEADHADEIVASEAEMALKRAQDQRKSAKDSISISEAEALIDRAQVRIKVVNLRRRKHR